MRFFALCALLISGFSQSLMAASANDTIEQLSIQVSPLWKSMRPVCVIAQDAKLQPALSDRLEFLDSRLVAASTSENIQGLLATSQKELKSAQLATWNKAWSNQVWSLREQLEAVALKAEDRENLREYFFKLQTQTPNKTRAQLVQKIQHMSEALNLSLRQELWKTCHALGLAITAQEQVEAAVTQRWIRQSKKVEHQLHKELAAFYFYSLRQVENPELAVLANIAEQLDAWVELASLAIQAHFTQLRSQLVLVPLQLPEENTDSSSSTEASFLKGLQGPAKKLHQL